MINKDRLFNRLMELGQIGNTEDGVYLSLIHIFIISAATAFGRALTLLQYPQMISGGILNNISNKFMIILVMNLILLVFGMIMDNIPNIMILTPIFLPVATSTVSYTHLDVYKRQGPGSKIFPGRALYGYYKIYSCSRQKRTQRPGRFRTVRGFYSVRCI